MAVDVTRDKMALINRMRKKAEDPATPPIRAAKLRETADSLEAATKGFFGAPQTVTVQQFVKQWAIARKIWEEFTGEDIV